MPADAVVAEKEKETAPPAVKAVAQSPAVAQQLSCSIQAAGVAPAYRNQAAFTPTSSTASTASDPCKCARCLLGDFVVSIRNGVETACTNPESPSHKFLDNSAFASVIPVLARTLQRPRRVLMIEINVRLAVVCSGRPETLRALVVAPAPWGYSLGTYFPPVSLPPGSCAGAMIIGDYTQFIVEELFMRSLESTFIPLPYGQDTGVSFVMMLVGDIINGNGADGNATHTIVFNYGAGRRSNVSIGTLGQDGAVATTNQSTAKPPLCMVDFSLVDDSDGLLATISPSNNARDMLNVLHRHSCNSQNTIHHDSASVVNRYCNSPKRLQLILKAHVITPRHSAPAAASVGDVFARDGVTRRMRPPTQRKEEALMRGLVGADAQRRELMPRKRPADNVVPMALSMAPASAEPPIDMQQHGPRQVPWADPPAPTFGSLTSNETQADNKRSGGNPSAEKRKRSAKKRRV